MVTKVQYYNIKNGKCWKNPVQPIGQLTGEAMYRKRENLKNKQHTWKFEEYRKIRNIEKYKLWFCEIKNKRYIQPSAYTMHTVDKDIRTWWSVYPSYNYL